MSEELKAAARSTHARSSFTTGLGLQHRAVPFRAAAGRLDPSLELLDSAPPKAIWDED